MNATARAAKDNLGAQKSYFNFLPGLRSQLKRAAGAVLLLGILGSVVWTALPRSLWSSPLSGASLTSASQPSQLGAQSSAFGQSASAQASAIYRQAPLSFEANL